MKIIVIGCGNVGSTIVKHLSMEGHDVTVVDSNEQIVKDATSALDVMGIVGNGSTLGVLKEADVVNADLVIAAMNSDERNLLACLIARKAGKCKTIARVRTPEYRKEIGYIKEELGLSMIFNPEFQASVEIARLIKFPSAIEIDSFAKGRVDLMKFEVKDECPLVNMSLKDMHKNLKSEVLICVVERGEQTIIPNGDFVINKGDKVYFVAPAKKTAQFFRTIGMLEERARNVMIVGGGQITEYLASSLISSGCAVKIFEKDPKRASELAEILPEAIVINADGGDKEIISEEGIDKTQAFVALTNRDEENVMMSIYAKKVNSKAKLITKVHRSTYDDIISDLNLGSIINPKLITGQNVAQFVRALQNSVGSNIETLYKLNEGRAEALEFIVREKSGLVDVPLMDLKLKPNVLIACIVHNGVVETPKGTSQIAVGDTVIVVTTTTGFSDIKDILR